MSSFESSEPAAPNEPVVPESRFELYEKINTNLARQLSKKPQWGQSPSGFTEHEGPLGARWQPLVCLPEEFVDSREINTLSEVVISSGRLFVGFKGGGFEKGWEFRSFANTNQNAGLVINGKKSIEFEFFFDGSNRWVYFDLTDRLNDFPIDDITAVELERDGRLLVSRLVVEKVASNSTASSRLVGFDSARRLFGWVTDGDDQPRDHWVLVEVGEQSLWTRSTARPGKADSQRVFAVDVRPLLKEGRLTLVSLSLPGGGEVARSPLWMTLSRQKPVILAAPSVRWGRFHATVRLPESGDMEGRCAIAVAQGGGQKVIARCDRRDPRAYRFGGGRNSFALSLARYGRETGPLLIVGPKGGVLAELPPLATILEATGTGSLAGGLLAGWRFPFFRS